MGGLTAAASVGAPAVTGVGAAARTWPELLDRLVGQGVLAGPITAARAAVGPLLVRVAASAGPEHLLLDVTDDPDLPQPATDAVGTGGLAVPTHLGSTATTAAVTAVAVDVGPEADVRAWFHRTPWPAAMLAEVATAAVPAPWPGEGVFAGLGLLLARLHSAPRPTQGPTQRPTTTSMPGQPVSTLPPIRRACTAAEYLTPAQQDQLATIVAVTAAATAEAPRPVHGQLALGHILVPTGPTRAGRPAAVVIDWTPGAVGSAGIDLGYLLGDLTEIAVLAGLTDPALGQAVRVGLRAVRDGYCRGAAAAPRNPADDEASPIDAPEFWDRVHDGALLRLLEHRATLARLVGPDAPPTRLTDHVFHQLSTEPFRLKGFRP